MAKGYWIAHIEVTDLESFKEYISVSTKAVTDYGGRFLVRGGQAENPEGALRPRHVLIEFPSYEIALECYHSPEYTAAMAMRRAHSEGDLVIVEGLEH